MNYYYDIILNWNELEPYAFYEWNESDYLELIKKIPYIKVSHKTFLEIYENKIKIDSVFLEKIKGKTLIGGNKIDRVDYALLLTDNKNVLALEFNDKGESISRSNLLIDDEVNALEVAYSLKETDLTYIVLEHIPEKKDLRQIGETKKFITLELNNLYKNKEISKLRYLYYEYKQVNCEDINEIYETLMEDLKNGFKEEFLKLYDIIKLSYHKV